MADGEKSRPHWRNSDGSEQLPECPHLKSRVVPSEAALEPVFWAYHNNDHKSPPILKNRYSDTPPKTALLIKSSNRPRRPPARGVDGSSPRLSRSDQFVWPALSLKPYFF